MILTPFWLPPVKRHGLIDQLEVERRAERLIQEFDIRATEQPATGKKSFRR